MTAEAKRDWTQHDIFGKTSELHSGPGFFQVLYDVCGGAFGGALEYGHGAWEFPMDDLTVGQLLDFFGEHKSKPVVEWHKESGGFPGAYILIDNYNLAEAFRAKFKIDWLTEDEQEDLRSRI
jgi:hypothetical protein